MSRRQRELGLRLKRSRVAEGPRMASVAGTDEHPVPERNADMLAPKALLLLRTQISVRRRELRSVLLQSLRHFPSTRP